MLLTTDSTLSHAAATLSGTGGRRHSRLRSIGFKLLLAFAAVGIIPAVAISLFGLNRTSSALSVQAFNHLEVVRDTKKAELEEYLTHAFRLLEDIPNNLRFVSALDELRRLFPKGTGSTEYQAAYARHVEGLKRFMTLNGFYDLFLFDLQGNVIFTVAQESDFGANLETGPLRESGLGRAYQRGKAAISFEDFAYYEPSKAPAAFVTLPLKDAQGVLIAVAGIQFSMDRIDALMNQRFGLGKTGAAYLVGPDGLMRTAIAHSASAGAVRPAKMESAAATEALKGNSGNGILADFRGVRALTAYAPIELGGVRWALIAQIDEDEVFQDTAAIRRDLLIIAGVGIALIVLAALLLSRTITRPIVEAARFIGEVAGGDLTRVVEVHTQDEIGDLGNSVRDMTARLRESFGGIGEHARVLASSAGELSTISQQMAASGDQMTEQASNVSSATEELSANILSMASSVEEMSVNVNSVSSSAEEMSQNMNSVSSAIEEMSASISDIASTARDASQVAERAESMSKSASLTMDTLGAAAKEIGEVTEVIKGIADQTNLLALNATIEAASAGDAGRGFAVVANEIKELANQSASAAEDIATKIGGVQTRTTEAVKIISEVADIIRRIAESITTITTAVNQQSRAASDISANVVQAAQGANNIASAIMEVSKGAGDMAANAGQGAKGASRVSANIMGITKVVSDNGIGIQQIRASAGELAKIAGELQGAVSVFKVA